MRSQPALLSKIPSLLALGLLVLQAALFWTAAGFVTQDGPSHVYTAVVARDLLLNRSSPYAAVYALQPMLLTNWGVTVVVGALTLVFPPEHAEQALATFCVILGFFGFAYLCRSLDQEANAWSPLLNFLLCAFFLWIGFYNFYLGMALLGFVVGYYVRHGGAMNTRRALVLAGGLVMLFFTHVLSLALALVSILVIAVWVRIAAPLIAIPRRESYRHALRQAFPSMVWLAIAILPALILSALQLWGSASDTTFEPNVGFAWNTFPMSIFASSGGRTGEQQMLFPAMLFYMAIAVLAMSRSEYLSARAGTFIAAALVFALYLVFPDTGFGGGGIKIRLAWAVFIFGCLTASTVAKLRALRLPISVYTACFLAMTLLHAMKYNVRNVSRAVEAYAAAMEQIPEGSAFVRVRFPLEATKTRYGLENLLSDPLYHVDAYVAARKRLLDLSDYQAISGAFPIKYRGLVPDEKQRQLWQLEAADSNTSAALIGILNDFPIPIDYVVVLGDSLPPSFIAELNANQTYLKFPNRAERGAGWDSPES